MLSASLATTARRVIRFRMELGELGGGLTTPHPPKKNILRHVTQGLTDSCKHGNETSGSIEDGDFVD
jgi:hypothetical protein